MYNIELKEKDGGFEGHVYCILPTKSIGVEVSLSAEESSGLSETERHQLAYSKTENTINEWLNPQHIEGTGNFVPSEKS